MLAGLAACMLAATFAFLIIRAAGGPDRGASSADLGDQSDATTVGQVVDAALAHGEPAAVPGESAAKCASETRGTYGRGLGSLVYTARLRWQSVPAVALAYQTAGPAAEGLDHQVFVVSTNGCQLLLAQRLEVGRPRP